MSGDKYKMFRNYMCNELGITKADIKAWVMESVAREVDKLVAQIDIEGRASSALDKAAISAVNNIDVRRAIAKEITNNLIVSIGIERPKQ